MKGEAASSVRTTQQFLERLLGRVPTAMEMAWLDKLAEKWKVSVQEAHWLWMREANGGRARRGF
jgi:hypothetical protein